MNIFTGFLEFTKEIYEKKSIIYQLTKRDIQTRYIGSSLGILWAIVQPLVMMLIYWFVFAYGFKAGKLPNGTPFLAYSVTGIVAWNFFSEAFVMSTNVFQEYSYLVKKINFKIAILPFVKIFSAMVTHLIFIIIVIVILGISRIPFSFYWFQVLYYMFALMVLVLGMSWVTSSLNVFVKDISQVVSVFLQFAFWLVPIFWSIDIVPVKYRILFMLNPLFYIVDGYRKSFIYQIPFWKIGFTTIYFWVITILILLAGVFIFRKLKPHFADVL